MQSTLENLFEHVIANPSRVDTKAGIIFGVKVLGKHSRNRREYSDRAMDQAAGLYEGKGVFLNHPDRNDPNADRQIADRFGRLVNVRRKGDAVYADLHYLTEHPLAAQVAEAAERMPEQLGLSHNADGKMVRRNGKSIIEEIVAVHSVDLVTSPATSGGLFESQQKGIQDMITTPANGKEMAEQLNKTEPWTNPNLRFTEGRHDIADVGQRPDKDAEKTRELLTQTNEKIEQAIEAAKEALDKIDLLDHVKEAGLNSMQATMSALVEDDLMSDETNVADEAVIGESYNYHLRRSQFSPKSRRIIEAEEAKRTKAPANGKAMADQLR